MTVPGVTNVAGIEIPSTSPVFLTIVGLHVLVGHLRGHRRHHDAQRETTGSPSESRHCLLLVPRGSFRVGNSGPHGAPATLAGLDQIAPHGNGPVVHPAADGFFMWTTDTACRFGKTCLPSPIGARLVWSEFRLSFSLCCAIHWLGKVGRACRGASLDDYSTSSRTAIATPEWSLTFPKDAAMPHVDNGSVRIHYQVQGEGPALVLQHGFTESVVDWYEAGYVERLRPDYRLIMIDARGHGASG